MTKSREQIPVLRVETVTANAVPVVVITTTKIEQDCHPRVKSRWQEDKEGSGILRVQRILFMYMPPFGDI